MGLLSHLEDKRATRKAGKGWLTAWSGFQSKHPDYQPIQPLVDRLQTLSLTQDGKPSSFFLTPSVEAIEKLAFSDR